MLSFPSQRQSQRRPVSSLPSKMTTTHCIGQILWSQPGIQWYSLSSSFFLTASEGTRNKKLLAGDKQNHTGKLLSLGIL